MTPQQRAIFDRLLEERRSPWKLRQRVQQRAEKKLELQQGGRKTVPPKSHSFAHQSVSNQNRGSTLSCKTSNRVCVLEFLPIELVGIHHTASMSTNKAFKRPLREAQEESLDERDVSNDSIGISAKRIRGGGGVHNPYATKKKPVNPYAAASRSSSSNKTKIDVKPNSGNKPSKPAAPKKEEDDYDEDMIEDYYQEEEEDVFMEEPNPANDGTIHNAQSVFSDITEDMKKRWLRPANQTKDNSQDLSLQWFDMDMIGGYALPQNPNETLDDRRVVGASEGQVPIIRAFGVTEAGNSATVFIHGFTPYGYFALPQGATFDHTEENLAKIRLLLNDRLEGQARGGKLHEYCHAVSYETDKKSIMGYESPHTHFFKVLVAMPTLIPTLKRIMEEGIDLAGVRTPQGNDYAAFECNVPFVLRYMIDNDISGAGWLTLPSKTYQVRQASDQKTHCQVRTTIFLLCGL